MEKESSLMRLRNGPEETWCCLRKKKGPIIRSIMPVGVLNVMGRVTRE